MAVWSRLTGPGLLAALQRVSIPAQFSPSPFRSRRLKVTPSSPRKPTAARTGSPENVTSYSSFLQQARSPPMLLTVTFGQGDNAVSPPTLTAVGGLCRQEHLI
ncbi:hypothetical protein AAFF_G00320800 [Aldrovandia affinis]|uniref:Uncharacterized protein n=1 Tax=Aldrovandia affinis TaxID=143900 RepID=A0AAD7R7D4_9TELE|nr:hypothetical protein AAFF_G00320800 [Aldrovandia affinis]